MIKIKANRQFTGILSRILQKYGIGGRCGGFTINDGMRAELGSKTIAHKRASQIWLEKERRALVPLFFDAEGASAIVNDSRTMSDKDDCVLT